MTEEKTAAELEAEKQAKAEEAKAEEAEAKDAEFETSIADLSDEEKEAKRVERKAASSDKKIDFEEELKKEKAARKKAEDALAENRFKGKNKETPEEKEAREEAEAKEREETTDESVSRIQEETRKGLKEINESQANVIAGQLAGEPAEKKLLVEKWKNRDFPDDMPLQEQMEEIHSIVHGSKLRSERNEAFRALDGKENVNTDGSGTHHDETKGKEPVVAVDVKSVLTRQGFTLNQGNNRWEKKLPNGKLMYRDENGKIRLDGVSVSKTPSS